MAMPPDQPKCVPLCIACERQLESAHAPKRGILLRVIDHFFPKLSGPPQHFSECLRDLRERLETDNDEHASELLAEATSAYDEVEARVAGVQQRAATLQGALTIAATVAIAGGGILLDASTVANDAWRIAFAACLVALVLPLIASVLFALHASSRTYWSLVPVDAEGLYERVRLPVAKAKSWRAAYLFQAYGHNDQIADLRVTYFEKSVRWFQRGLLILAVLIALTFAYILSHL